MLKRDNEKQQSEIEDLRKRNKVCVFNELDIQLETYSDECKRLRKKLEEAITLQSQQNKENEKLKRALKSLKQKQK